MTEDFSLIVVTEGNASIGIVLPPLRPSPPSPLSLAGGWLLAP